MALAFYVFQDVDKQPLEDYIQIVFEQRLTLQTLFLVIVGHCFHVLIHSQRHSVDPWFAIHCQTNIIAFVFALLLLTFIVYIYAWVGVLLTVTFTSIGGQGGCSIYCIFVVPVI